MTLTSMRSTFLALAAVVALALPTAASASHVADTVRGRILLQVESEGEAWYVDPASDARHYLGRPADAFAIMRALSLGITDADLARIPASDDDASGDAALRERLSGTILLQVEANGEAWYVHPVDLRRYYLGRPADAFAIMRALSLGITDADLSHVPIADDSIEPPPKVAFGSYVDGDVATSVGTFRARVVTLDRANVRMVTDVAHDGDCDGGCAAAPLADYAAAHGAIAAIHGTYFCPPDYASCAGKEYSFLPPVFDSAADVMRNEDIMIFHDRPIVVATDQRDLVMFHRSSQFSDNVAEFEAATGEKVAAAIGNWPSLVEYGANMVPLEPSEPGFFVRATRGGIGWDDERIFVVIGSAATMEEFAEVLIALGADFAMNLDGGGSAALWFDGGYKAGPGRLLPNAVLFLPR